MQLQSAASYLWLSKAWKQKETASLALLKGNKIHLLVPLKLSFVHLICLICTKQQLLSSSSYIYPVRHSDVKE